MTDSWGRPGGAEPGGAGTPPHRAGRIGQQVARTNGPLFADEYPDHAAQSRGAEPHESTAGYSRSQMGPGRAQTRRAAAGTGPEPGRPTAIGMLVLILVPLLGALVTGSGLGVIFTACAALGAALAAGLVARRVLWWIVTAAPAVVLLIALVAGEAGASAGSTTTARLATNMLAWTAHAFPVMAVATGAALAVTVVRAARGAGTKGHGHG